MISNSPTPRIITVRALKYDGNEHRRWRAELIEHQNSHLVLDGTFEHEIRHSELGVIAPGTKSVEYYWLDRWFNVFRFLQPTGELRNYYCNINVPPVFADDELSYIDLDVDILVAPDFKVTIIDEPEFDANALRFAYPDQVLANARQTISEVVEMIEARRYPFDG